MESYLKLAVLTALVCVSLGQDVTVKLDISESQVHTGANITLNCRIQGIGPGEIVYWSKGEQVGDDDALATQLIATNDLLSPLYQSLGRYQPSVVQVGTAYLYIMHIYRVTEEESGNYACSLPRLAYKHDYKPLFVFEQAKDIAFLNVTENENEPIVLTEGEPRDIHCHVEEVNPVPSISMMMGKSSIANLEIKPEKNLHCASSVENCPLNTDFDVHVIARKHNATWWDNGEKIVCKSHLRESRFNPMEVHRDVKVLYRPKMQCTKLTKSALGKSSFNITCTVRMNPLPLVLHEDDSSAAYWQFTVDGTESKIYNNQQIGDFAVSEKGVNDTARMYTLTIDTVRPSHFNTTYNLHVHNTIGHNTTGIMLMQENTGTPERPIGGAGALWLSLTTLILATLFSVSEQRH